MSVRDTEGSVVAGSAEPVREIVYVGDPMCSWCWGFAAEVAKLRRLRPELPVRIVVGGLRPGPAAEPMTDAMERFLAHHWEEVAQRSGQPFDTDVLGRRDWIYDTETPCRAVVAARGVDPDWAWPVFERLQRAFYAEGIIVSRTDVYPDVLQGTGIDLDSFEQAFHAEDAVRQTWDDFALARRWGVTGFPTTILRTGDTGRILAAGYTSADRLDQLIDSVVDRADA